MSLVHQDVVVSSMEGLLPALVMCLVAPDNLGGQFSRQTLLARLAHGAGSMAAVVAQQLAAHRNSKHEDGFPFHTNMALLACGATSTVAKHAQSQGVGATLCKNFMLRIRWVLLVGAASAILWRQDQKREEEEAWRRWKIVSAMADLYR